MAGEAVSRQVQHLLAILHTLLYMSAWTPNRALGDATAKDCHRTATARIYLCIAEQHPHADLQSCQVLYHDVTSGEAGDLILSACFPVYAHCTPYTQVLGFAQANIEVRWLVGPTVRTWWTLGLFYLCQVAYYLWMSLMDPGDKRDSAVRTATQPAPCPWSRRQATAILQRRLYHRSRPGPKSRGRSPLSMLGRPWMLFLLWGAQQLTIAGAAVDARVGPFEHHEGPRAIIHDTSANGWAKHGVSSHIANEACRKRALRRAYNRAAKDPTGCTWYRGRRLHYSQLDRGQVTLPCPRPDKPEPKSRSARRLRIVTWNTGGLSSTRYNEILEWLTQEAQRGHPVDVIFLQETCWKQDLEYVATPPTTPTSEQLSYQVVHSAGPEKTGVMCLIRTGVVPASGIRHMSS